MAKIGILYICTGKYYLFWEDFYTTFKQYFCKNSELHFYVFSDNDMTFEGKEYIHFHKIQNQPWPLITLLRFNTFLSIEDEIKDCDYLYFFNSNMVCKQPVTEEEFLPNENEELVFVRHPGYYKTKKMFIPYDRNPKCTAYVPYNRGGIYVIGAVEGGKTDSFLSMCHTLKDNIEKDLKQNIIAKWHDESQINYYNIVNKNYKLLNPGYCYPVGFDLPFESKIAGVSKQAKFDVKNFKTVSEKLNLFQKGLRYVDCKIFPILRFFRDLVLIKRVKGE